MQQLLQVKYIAVVLTSLLDGRVIAANAKFLKTFGFAREEIIGKTTLELNLWASSDERDKLINALLMDGSVEEFRAVSCLKSGRAFTYRWFAELGVFNGQQCVAGMVYDVAETNQAVSACDTTGQTFLDKYREIVEAAPVIIMTIDETGVITFINQFGCDLFGYRESELIGCHYRQTFLPEFESTGRNLWDAYQAMFANKANYDRSICEVVKKDGRRVWIEWINHFKKHPATGRVYVITVGVDITAQRQAAVSAKRRCEQGRRNKLFNDVIANRITEAEFLRITQDSGYCLDLPLICLIAVLDAADDRLAFFKKDSQGWQARFDTAIDLIWVRLGGLAWHAEDRIVILQPCSKPVCSQPAGMAAMVGLLSHVIKDVFRGIPCMIGVSTAYRNLKTVYTQANEAVLIGPIFCPDRELHCWRDLGVNRLLVEQAKSSDGLVFIQDYLGPLLEKASLRNEEWLLTLRELLSGDSMNTIAKRLHIHPKTLAFRKNRIKRLLQIELDDPEERLNIAVAFKLKQLRDKLLP